jgi:PKD repeat protein
MKIFYTIAFVASALMMTKHSSAQCAECVPDETCIPEVAFPTICPEVLPDATAGEFYETVVTFYMPAEVEDPESGFVVTLNEILVAGLSGLPFGLSYELSGDDNLYFPSQGEQFGCVNICGTPILPGTYTVNVNVVASVIVFGTNQTMPQSFSIDLIVLPGEGGTNSFVYNNQAACDSLAVQFEALINGNPNPTSWSWDFGNGNTSNEQIPAIQIYDEPGEYTVSCTTIITEYFLQSVNVTSFADGWSGDAEEISALFFNPDPYFILTDASNAPVYQSSTIDDVLSASWTNLGVPLSNPPYTISFYDEDLISDTDFLGSYSLTFGPGAFSFNAGGTQGILVIEAIDTEPIYDEQIFTVFPEPNALFNIDEDNNVLSYNDPELDTYTWFFNGDTITNAMGSSLEMLAPGVYSCSVTNIYGCSGLSEEYVLCPEISIVYDPFNETLSVATGFETYHWEYNGLPLEGETGNSISSYGLGNYAVSITTSYGCEVESEVYSITVGVEELNPLIHALVYPNPGKGNFNIKGVSGPVQCEVYDLRGRLVFQEALNYDNTLNLNQLAEGAYTLKLIQKSHHQSLRLLISSGD